MIRACSLFLVLLVVATFGVHPAWTQDADELEDAVSNPNGEEELQAPEKVEVSRIADDDQIASRLEGILEATEWFDSPEVKVDEGVVFLSGSVETEQHRDWAEQLASNTQDVVAVVNRIQVREKSMWDLSSAFGELQELGVQTVRNSPLFLVALVFVVASWFVTKWSVAGVKILLRNKISSHMLRDVTARAVAVPIFLFGLYLALKVSGLSRLAVTVLGGTGLVGLVIGFAFRDIAENFLASILISIQHPFARGDLIEVAGHKGFVQSVNTRSTLLMTLEGNHIQIPNATIYKETIINYTANPFARFDFVVGIGYDDAIAEAQEIALKVLGEHPAIVAEPEPMVLVESLGAATVNLRAYFWVDIAKYSHFKVKSAIVRLTKRAFDEAGISMPDEAREVVFPKGVPVQMLADEEHAAEKPLPETRRTNAAEPEDSSAEADLSSESADIQQQAEQARSPEGGENLLQS